MVRFLHAVSQEGSAELREFDLSPAQYQLLVYIDRKPGVAQWQLVDAFGVTKGNVSQLVKRLESAGLVHRARVETTDQLTLTSSGQALVDRVVPAHEAYMERVYGHLSADELDALQRLLLRLVNR